MPAARIKTPPPDSLVRGLGRDVLKWAAIGGLTLLVTGLATFVALWLSANYTTKAESSQYMTRVQLMETFATKGDLQTAMEKVGKDNASNFDKYAALVTSTKSEITKKQDDILGKLDPVKDDVASIKASQVINAERDRRIQKLEDGQQELRDMILGAPPKANRKP